MIRTGYSFRTAVGHLSETISRLKELNWPAAPIADRTSTFGFVPWRKECKAQGIRPVYGVELGVSPDPSAKNPLADYWVFLAKTDMADLHRLIQKATMDAPREPLLTYANAMSAPGVIKIAQEWTLLDHVDFSAPELYMGLTPATTIRSYREATTRGARFLPMPRNAYPREGDIEFYRVLLGKRSSTQTYPQHIVSDDELREATGLLGAQVDPSLRESVLAECTADLKQAQILHYPAQKSLRDLCLEGAKRVSCDLSNPVYAERLERELNLIKEKNFEDYFYIIADLLEWARGHMVVGPARGSSCGSLACWLLGITSIDPIPHGLLFERFIDVTRADLPDIDLDFSDEHRHLVFEYAERKYGSRAARLGSVGIFQTKSALNKAAPGLKIPQWMADSVGDAAIKRMKGDSRKGSTIEDTLLDTDPGKRMMKEFPESRIVARFEGHPDFSGVHAAGLVVTDEPVVNYVAVDMRTKTTMCNKYDAEALNLLKIDILGLTQLSIFERTLELIGEAPRSDYLERIPLDDKAAFDVLNRRKYCGIFQFEAAAMRGLAKQITFETLDDIIAAVALVRPGPMVSGGTTQWVNNRSGKTQVSYPHPMLEPYMKDTYGVMVYQEQVLKIGRELGDLSWAEVTELRKAMSKSLGKEYFDRFGDKWKAAAIAKGLPKEVAEPFWNGMCLEENTLIKLPLANSKPLTIKELYEKYEASPSWENKRKNLKPALVSLFPDGRGRIHRAIKIIKSGRKLCWKYTFDDESSVTCTPDHLFIINGKWKQIGKANIGDDFLFMTDDYSDRGARKRGRTGKGSGTGKRDKFGRYVPFFRYQIAREFKIEMKHKPCIDCGKLKKIMNVHHNDFVEGRRRPRDLAWLCISCHRSRHWQAGKGATPLWGVGKATTSRLLIKRQRVGEREVYDISMSLHPNFTLQNGLIAHNCQFGAWAFNKAHSVGYAYVSYWCAYLKAHFPIEFAAATLDYELNTDKQIKLLRELNEEGIGYVAVDPNASTDRWQAKDGKLLGPLTNIKGIGPGKLKMIMDRRDPSKLLYKKPLTPSLAAMLNNPKTPIDSIYPVRTRLEQLYPNGDLAQMRNITSRPTNVIDIVCEEEHVALIFVVINRIIPTDANEPAKVARRGYELKGKTAMLNMFVNDDTDEMFCQIRPHNYETIGKAIQDRGRPGKIIYAMKGVVPAFTDFKMMFVDRVKWLGDMEMDEEDGRGAEDNLSQAPAQGSLELD